MGRSLSLAAMGMFLAGGAAAAEAGTTCRTSHNLVGACFTVHGRLFEAAVPRHILIAANDGGAIFDILDRQALADTAEALPAAVHALFVTAPAMTDIYGDYDVCPFEKDTAGIMRAVCIQSASHLIARQR